MDFESSLLEALSSGNIESLKKLGVDRNIANEIVYVDFLTNRLQELFKYLKKGVANKFHMYLIHLH